MGKIGVVRDKRYLDHDTGSHPESPQRLRAIYDTLDQKGLSTQLTVIPARNVTQQELELIHSSEYISRVRMTREQEVSYLDADTVTCAASYEVALWAAGGVLQAVDKVATGDLEGAFALIRPPGHHAERDRGMGFCLFNNVAIAARYAQKKHHLKRILIADWDLHHGNATQHSFYDDKEVLYFSTHQYPYYPGTGGFREVGRGEGEGFTINVPLGGGQADADYIKIYKEILYPIGLAYQPDMVLVSAGFDISSGDPLGGMRVTPAGFGNLIKVLVDIARECCGGKVLITLEGGYDLKGLSEGVAEVFRILLGGEVADIDLSPPSRMEDVISRVKTTHSPFWKCLKK